MPTKHIDKLLWERIEQKTVDIVILQRKMVERYGCFTVFN